MPKRSVEEKIEKYLKKLEKWKRRRLITSPNSSDSDPENDIGEARTDPQWETYHEKLKILSPEANNIQPIEESVEAPNKPVSIPCVVEPVKAPTTEDPPTNPGLDPSILAALGEIVDDSPDFGDKIHDSLAKIWTPILKKGISKENRDKIIKEYLIPENCPLLKAPTLNPEIMAAITETGRFRDKEISLSQQQLGVGITAINRGLNSLITSENKIKAIKFLSDGCRLLSDLHFQQTETRKKYITPCLDKFFLHLIQGEERDDTLFGQKISEKIEASEAILTQSKLIKKPTVIPKPSTSQPTPQASNQGNWQGPPRSPANRGRRGGFMRINQCVQKPAPPAQQPQSQSNAYQTRSRRTNRQSQA